MSPHSLLHTLRELLRTTHCLQARACVAYNLHRVERARVDLAKAYAALDACEAQIRITRHVERPALPGYLNVPDETR